LKALSYVNFVFIFVINFVEMSSYNKSNQSMAKVIDKMVGEIDEQMDQKIDKLLKSVRNKHKERQQ